MKDYKELDVWQKAMNLVTNIYGLCKVLPKEELYSLSDQTKRCAISIPANIAEGSGGIPVKSLFVFYIFHLEVHMNWKHILL